MRIGVLVDSFRAGLEGGLRKAVQVGVEGVQIYAVDGEMAPENLNASRRREIRRLVADSGLVVSALCGDLGGYGFARPEEHPWKIEKSRRILELAVDLESKVVTTHIGVVPKDPGHPRYAHLQRACEAIGRHGDALGVAFAIETGPEPADVLRRFIDGLDTGSVKVNLDPANLVMVTGTDPVEAVHILKEHIVHTHAKDGIRLRKADPELVYEGFAKGGIEGLPFDELFREVPLGRGGVDFDAYLAALEEIGYTGFLTIEREVGEDPEEDIRGAVDFLKERLGRLRHG